MTKYDFIDTNDNESIIPYINELNNIKFNDDFSFGSEKFQFYNLSKYYEKS